MKTEKMMAFFIGATFTLILMLGIGLMLFGENATVAMAIAVICISLASGLIIPNPLSLAGLIAGICMLVFPSKAVGIVLIAAGIMGIAVNTVIFANRTKHRAQAQR